LVVVGDEGGTVGGVVVGGNVVVSGSPTAIWMNPEADAPSGSVTV
jgi:hypothetical protein